MLHLIPAPLHRAAMPLAHAIRHRWRAWRQVRLRGCAVVVTDFAGNVLLLRLTYGPDAWSLPGGGLSRNEDPEVGSCRELHEELALECDQITLVGTLEEVISRSPQDTWIYTTVTDKTPQPDCREVREARFFPPHSLPEPLGELTRVRLAVWRRSLTAR